MVLSAIPVILALPVAATLTLAAVHVFVWLELRRATGGLFLSLGAALALTAMVYLELRMMRVQTPGEYGAALRWLHVPVWLIIMVVAGFVHFHLKVGRRWLVWSVFGARTAALLLNFVVGENLNYLEITHLRQVSFLGDVVSIPMGVPNPLMLVGQLSLLLLLVFVVDAMIELWRRGDWQRALVVGSGIVVFVLFPTVEAVLVVLAVVDWPPTLSIFFAPLAAAMSYDMSRDVVRSELLAGELRTSESTLHRTEERLKLATEGARLAVWEWNIDRDELWFAEQGHALLGFALDERIDFARFLNAVHPEDRDGILEAVALSRREGTRYERDYRILLPDGRIHWVAARGQVDGTVDGAEEVMRGVLFDITDRKQAEERFRRVVEASPCGMIMMDTAGLITYVNPQVEAYFGYACPELIGCSIEVLLPEHLRSAEAHDTARDRAEPAERIPMEHDVVGRRKDGSEFPLQVGLSLLPGPAGKTLLATVIDLSELKQREDQLWRDKAFLRQVIDINPGLIFVKDPEGRFTLVNQTVADLYGTTPRELIGKMDADFNPNVDEVAAFLRADREVLATRREQFIVEERITDAKGAWHWLQTIKRPIVERDGTARLVLGVSTDITARKATELEIELQRNELAHLSRVTMLSELSGSLAHELNQPLAAILSNAQAALRFLASDAPDLKEVSEILRDIVEDDRRAGGVIQGLRLLLKKGEMRLESIDLNEAVRAVLRLVRSDMLNADVGVNTTLAPDLPNVRGDRVQLQQVLLNLVVNACDAMSAEPVEDRRLSVTSAICGDGLVEVSVTDQGRGIAAEDLERVFQPFVSSKAEGLGLGLAVCRRIVEAHGGRLWAAHNSSGRGACFCFTVPAHSGDST